MSANRLFSLECESLLRDTYTRVESGFVATRVAATLQTSTNTLRTTRNTPRLSGKIYWLLACLALVCGEVHFAQWTPRLVAQNPQVPQTDRWDTRVESEWNRTFDFGAGWTGGDGAGTVDLGRDRILWMFADSLVGEIDGSKHAAGTRMVNNVLAIQSFSGATKPDAGQFSFFWGDRNKKNPAAWCVPDPQYVRPTVELTHPKHPNGWYWPAGGAAVVGTVDPKLVLFCFHVGRTVEDRGVWSFKNVGGAMLVVDNPQEDPDAWQPRQVDLGFVVDADQVAGNKRLKETSWGMSCCSLVESEDNRWVLVFGNRQASKFNRELLVARVRPGEIEDTRCWEFFTGDQDNDRWSSDASLAVGIAERVAAEFSIHHLTSGETSRWVMVHSHALLGTGIYIRTAEHAWGPWSDPEKIYDVPDVAKSRNYFTYAAKAHPKVSPPGRLQISYVVNSTDFWEMLSDTSIYKPRFISINIEALFTEDK